MLESSLLHKLVANLMKAQTDPECLAPEIETFLSAFHHAPQGATRTFPEPIFDLLADLAMDLEYYVADPKARAEDPAYFGDEKALEKIESALSGLKSLGIEA